MSDDFLKIDRDGPVAIITINRPKTLNALDMPLLLELESRFDALEKDAAVRVIVFTGAGRAFVAGGDIADLNSRRGLAHYEEFAELIHRVFRKIELCDKPTIAAVNGFALGGGTELLLALDIRILSDQARLGLPEITLGLFPGAGGTQRIIRQIPLCRAKEIMFAGGQISADEAVAIGLANKVVPHDVLMTETLALAHKIAEKSPLVLKLLKRTISDGGDMPLSSALRHEQSMIGLVLDTDDSHEGCSAFLEKRKPVFRGA
ncbi:enoyl-CoA hydratase [Rhodoligotrophos appendicifer]|uniref:enoyl-CoA hydratase/isomerase family protein n=1 Tax=Rhodoligotrophos appendicifer TaxID=987056 RepID=UPI0011847189|nr:enoyl-CoA hydratase-related protein [Rhodoligotrophos appendicifer]